jgi:hypothetical protein
MPMTVLSVLLAVAAALALRFRERSAPVLEPAAG